MSRSFGSSARRADQEPVAFIPDDHSLLVARLVIECIGRPDHMHHCAAHYLWHERYRVNVWCWHDDKLLIDLSFFVVFNGYEIVRSSPTLTSYGYAA